MCSICAAFVDRAARGTDVVGEAEKDFLDRPSGQGLQVQRAQSLLDAPGSGRPKGSSAGVPPPSAMSPCVVRSGARRRSLSALAAATFKAGLLAEVDQRSRRRVKLVANGGVDDGGIPAARQGFEEIDEACSGGPGYARTKDGETGDLLGAGGLDQFNFSFSAWIPPPCSWRGRSRLRI